MEPIYHDEWLIAVNVMSNFVRKHYFLAYWQCASEKNAGRFPAASIFLRGLSSFIYVVTWGPYHCERLSLDFVETQFIAKHIVKCLRQTIKSNLYKVCAILRKLKTLLL